jgi:energy-coupling factor transporter ATP-binding protein EcfA2
MFQFKKATREKAKARVALIGPSGSGKTYTALLLATLMGKRVAVIDSEHGSASKYAGITDPASGVLLDFDVLELDSFSPETYALALEAAQKAGYDAIVVDSLSHAWMGKDGALELVDKAAKKNQGNSYVGWRDVTPKHNAMIDALVSCQAHLFVTMRSKTEYVLEEDARTGKKVPRKVGLAPIQRDGLEYEFDVVGDLDLDHNYIISKTRCPMLDGALINKPGAKLVETLHAWLETGEAPKPAPPPDPREWTFPSGQMQGQKLGDLTATQLLWYAEKYRGKDTQLPRLARAVLDMREQDAEAASREEPAPEPAPDRLDDTSAEA